MTVSCRSTFAMKQITILSFLFLFIFPTLLKAQWKSETGFTLGFIDPGYDKGFNGDRSLGPYMKLGIAQSWNNPDSRFSFRPEIGINAESVSVDMESGGIAVRISDSGTILSINGELAAMAQLRITKQFVFACGPAAKYLLTDKTYMVHKFLPNSSMTDLPASEEKYDGFNRRYLNQPSLGIKALFFKRNLNEKIDFGMAVDCQWKKDSEEIFNFTKTVELSFYLGID